MKEIYYIGGSPCSGKSTIAEMLAIEYGFAYYKLDDYLWTYMEQAATDGKPLSTLQLAMNFEQMWMRSPGLQAQDYGYHSIVVDGKQSIEENYSAVVRAFELDVQP